MGVAADRIHLSVYCDTILNSAFENRDVRVRVRVRVRA